MSLTAGDSATLGRCAAGPVQGYGLVVLAGEAVDVGHQAGRAHPQGGELDAAFVEFAEDGLGGDLLVHDEHLRVGSGYGFPVVAERDDFPVLGGLGDAGVGVEEVVRAGVLGEEGEYRAGPLGAPGDVVLFQDRVVSPVQDGVEVQVEDRLLAGRQALAGHFLVEGGQEPLLVVVGQPVGVVGERGFLRQDRQPGEQGAGGVGEQVVDVADTPGGGELEGQQGQDAAGGRDGCGAGVARRVHQGRQVEGDQVGNGQQQPGEPGVGPAWSTPGRRRSR